MEGRAGPHLHPPPPSEEQGAALRQLSQDPSSLTPHTPLLGGESSGRSSRAPAASSTRRPARPRSRLFQAFARCRASSPVLARPLLVSLGKRARRP